MAEHLSHHHSDSLATSDDNHPIHSQHEGPSSKPTRYQEGYRKTSSVAILVITNATILSIPLPKSTDNTTDSYKTGSHPKTMNARSTSSMEAMGFEPTTFGMQSRRSPN